MNPITTFFILLVLLILSSTLYYHTQHPPIPFNSAAWKAWVEQEDNIDERWSMARNLVRSRQLIGKTRAEVVDLLGETFGSSNRLSYNTGPCKGGFLTIDYSVLEVTFKRGRVDKVEIDCH